MNKKAKRNLYLSILMLIIGIALAGFVRSMFEKDEVTNKRAQTYHDSLLEYEALQAQNQRLIEQNELLEQKKSFLLAGLEGEESYEQVISEREKYALLAGLTSVEGSGIRVILQDKIDYDATLDPEEAIVHDTTILHVLDILRANGALALSFNDTRLTAIPQIGCIGPTILCYNNRQMPPYVIEAIGPAEEMKQAIAVDSYLKYITDPTIGIRMDYKIIQELELPSFSRTEDYRTLISLLEAN